MHPTEIAERRARVVAEHGPWTAHNVRLPDGSLTLSPGERVGAGWKVQRAVQAIGDLVGRPWEDLRILDLGCLEGQFAVEFALRGARVTAVEGRRANLAKAEFCRDAFGLERLELRCDDVRNLSAAAYGTFDVVLCSGILYHLDAPDAFEFLARVAEVCTRLALVDTHVSLRRLATAEWRGRTYHGRWYVEFPPGAPPEVKLRANWAALDNDRSFWLTLPSLVNLLTDVGFTSVHQVLSQARTGDYADRVALAAIKGRPEPLRTGAEGADAPVLPGRLPEVSHAKPFPFPEDEGIPDGVTDEIAAAIIAMRSAEAEIRAVAGRLEQTRLAEISAEQLRAYQDALRRTADSVRDLQRSWTWRVGRAVVGPVAWVLRGLGLIGRRPPECGSQNAQG